MQTVDLPAPLRGRTPEWRALIGLTAPVPRPPTEPVDWDRLIRLARRHGVVLGLARGARQAGCALPEAAQDRLTELQKPTLVRAMAHAAETARLARVLEQAGIAAVFVKGPALAVALCGGLARRDPGDIDLLVAPETVAVALNVLAAAGYKAGPEAKLLHDPHWWSHVLMAQKDLVLVNPQNRFAIELHWRIGSRNSFDTNTLLAGAGHEIIAGTDVPVPDRLVHAVYLCAHGLTHCWSRLKWLNDLRWTLADAAWIDDQWEALAGCAQTRGLGGMVWSALTTAATIDGRPLPAPVAQLAPPAVRARRAQIRIHHAMMEGAETLTAARGFAARRQTLRRLRATVSLAGPRALPLTLGGTIRLLLTPTAQDLTTLRLPYTLRAGYLLLRPALIAHRVLRGAR